MLQGDQSGCRLLEAAGIEVERTKVFLEVNVEPLALRGTSFVSSSCDQRASNTAALAMLGDYRVQDEGVNSAVPDHVDEADQRAVFPSADPAEAVALESFSPVSLSDRVAEAVSMQRVEGGVVEVAPPLVLDRHSSIVESGSGPAIGLRSEENSLAEEFETSAAEHLTLEHLDPVDVAFDDA